jgi:hypothetical protein
VKELSAWPDGSLRWVLLHFQANIGAQSRQRYTLQYGDGIRRSESPDTVHLEREGGVIVLDSGPLRVRLSGAEGVGLQMEAWLHGGLMLDAEGQSGFVLRNARGTRFSSRQGEVTSVTVEEAGPLRAIIHAAGDHRNERSERLFGWEMRLYCYAHLPWLEIEYTFINDEDAQHTPLQRIGFELRPTVGSDATGLCGAYEDLYERPDPFNVYIGSRNRMGRFFRADGALIHDQDGQLVQHEGEGKISQLVAHGWMDVSGRDGGVSIALKNMAQLYPKRMAFTGEGLQVDLWPAQAGTLRWHQGMARTHRFLLYFHRGSGRASKVNELCTCYDDDLLLWAPGWYAESGAMGPLFAHQPERYPHIEAALRDYFCQWRANARTQGFADYGDQWMTWAAEQTMANNYIDTALGLALQYARVGERMYYEELEATAWHTMDVDVVHHTTMDPLELGGQRHTGPGHVEYDCEGASNITVAPSQMWTEGLLHYYHLSGHPRALQIACGIGDCFLRMLDRGWGLPPYDIAWHGYRDSGWPLTALLALYETTGEERWMAGCQRILEALVEVQNRSDVWTQEQAGWHRSYSALHLGVIITALSNLHRVTGDERAHDLLIRLGDIFLRQCSFPEGTMVYVTVPFRRWNYYSGLSFESLGYLWELTGDERYLRLGWLAHRHELGAWGASGPIPFRTASLASAWRGNLRYMHWADQAGLLTDLSP